MRRFSAILQKDLSSVFAVSLDDMSPPIYLAEKLGPSTIVSVLGQGI